MLKKKKKKKKERKTNKQTKKKQSRKNYKENTGTKLISITKKHKLKIQGRVWNFRYTMLYKRRRERNRGKRKKRVTEIIKKTIGTKLVRNTKKLKLKLQSTVWNFKNTMLKKRRKKNQGQKNYKKCIYEVCIKKNRFFFFFAK